MGKKIEVFVPGRLCLFGEHTDWAGRYNAQNVDVLPGKAIVTGINLGIYATAEKAKGFSICTVNENGEKIKFHCEMHREILRKKALEDPFFGYCCGVAAHLRENYHVEGVSIDVTNVTLPMKKGLSSSAAICVLVTRVFNELYDLRLSTRGIMRIAYLGERMTQSRCGRLDQACAFGSVPVLMEFSDDDIIVDKLHVGKNLHWVFADLCAGKDTKKILSSLNRAYPFAQTKQDEDVQYALGQANHEIIARAVEAIDVGDDVTLGNLLCEAQEIFDKKVAPVCSEELTSPVLHSVLRDKQVRKWILGGKGVGSQGDGSVQFLAKDKKSQRELVKYLNEVRKMEAFPFDIEAGGKVRKAIIPVAGFGMRMFPETHFIKKAFLPIIDEKGIVKPVLLSILEELEEAQIEQFILVVGEDEEKEFREVFEFNLESEFRARLPKNVRKYYDVIHRIGSKIKYAVQRERKGFGHAVYQARQYVKDEPVLLLLGDFVYKSNLSISCTRQTIAAYNKSGGKAIVSIKPVPLDQVVYYGIITGEFDDQRKDLMHVSEMVEKPTVEYAREFLGVNTENNPNRYFATFGQYVLTEDIFVYLENQIKAYNKKQLAGEIDLTSALRETAHKGGLVAVQVDGESYDVGIPELYSDTLNKFVSNKKKQETNF